MRVCPNAPPAMLGRLKQAKKIVENERTEALEAKKLGIRYPDLGPSGYDQTTITLFERLMIARWNASLISSKAISTLKVWRGPTSLGHVSKR